MDLLNCFIALQLHIFSHCNQHQEKWWIWLRLWEASYYNTKSKGFGAGKWSYYTTKLEGLGSQKWGKIRGGWNQRHPKRTSLQLHPVHRLFSLHHRVCVDFWVDNSHGSVTTSIRTSGSGHRSSWNSSESSGTFCGSPRKKRQLKATSWKPFELVTEVCAVLLAEAISIGLNHRWWE